jgi:transposase-like protein
MCEGKLKRLVTHGIFEECSMVVIPVRCPSCERDTVVKRGRTDSGKQRYLCQNVACFCRIFLLDYTNRGYMPSVKRQIIDLTLNGSGIRDIARVLRISTDTVIGELKKKKASLKQ